MKSLIYFSLLSLSLISTASAEISYLITDNKSNFVISSDNSDVQRPMASLTKIMTAAVILDSAADLNQKVPYRGRIFRNKKVSRYHLLESLLIKSDNNAAESLARSWPGGRDLFIQKMNETAREIGMLDTVYRDPSGLDRGNLSTARDLTLLVRYASGHRLIKEISSSKSLDPVDRRRKRSFYNTNFKLLNDYQNIHFSKTGFTNAAGRCLAIKLEDDLRDYTVIILGARTANERLSKAKYLIDNFFVH